MLRLLLVLLLLPVMPTWADESLLWKATNVSPAQVVPTYAGQGSPFPQTMVPVADPSQTEVLDEQARMREEAFSYAQGILNGGAALQPELRTLRIGGILVGSLGPRVLINNQWLGQGDKLNVRQVKTTQAMSALKTLAEYDATAAAELTATLNADLAARPAVAVTLRTITSSSVVIEGPQGRSTLSIPKGM